jgi:hypothetical protein
MEAGARFAVATEDLTRLLDEAGVRYELLPHARTESALAEAEALGVAAAGVAKTLVVTTPEGYVRAVLPAWSGSTSTSCARSPEAAGRKSIWRPRKTWREITPSSTWEQCHRSAEADAIASSSIAVWPSASRSCWRQARMSARCASRPRISCGSPKPRSPTSAWTSQRFSGGPRAPGLTPDRDRSAPTEGPGFESLGLQRGAAERLQWPPLGRAPARTRWSPLLDRPVRLLGMRVDAPGPGSADAAVGRRGRRTRLVPRGGHAGVSPTPRVPSRAGANTRGVLLGGGQRSGYPTGRDLESGPRSRALRAATRFA